MAGQSALRSARGAPNVLSKTFATPQTKRCDVRSLVGVLQWTLAIFSVTGTVALFGWILLLIIRKDRPKRLLSNVCVMNWLNMNTRFLISTQRKQKTGCN